MQVVEGVKEERPLKLDEGSLLEVLEAAASKGDHKLAAAAWDLLRRCLAQPNCPSLPGRARELAAACAVAAAASGAGGGQPSEDEEPGQLGQQQGGPVAGATAAPAAELGAEQAQQAQQAEHEARPPQVVSFHALIHAYARANQFG